MQKFLLTLVVSFISFSAQAEVRCFDLFAGEKRPVSLQTTLSTRARLTGFVEKATISEDGQTAALLIAEGEGRRPNRLELVDLQTGKTVFQKTFLNYVKKAFFVPGSDLLAIDAADTNEGHQGQVARLFMINWKLGPNQRSNTPDRLDVPGSPHWGVGVAQIVARHDLPYMLVVEKSENPLRTIQRPDYKPEEWVDPMTSLLNYGAHAFEAGGLQPMGSLVYDNLQPVAIALNPQSKLMAMNLQNPIVSQRDNPSVFVVDAMNPKHVLYQWQPRDMKSRGPVPSVELKARWSENGQKLLTLERHSGRSQVWDVTTGEVQESAGSGPLAGGAILSNHETVLLRRQVDGKYLEMSLILEAGTKPPVELKITQRAFWSEKVPGSEAEIFEMRNGRVLVIHFQDQLLIVDRENPKNYSIFSPEKLNSFRGQRLVPLKKISENVLRVVDLQGEIFDLTLPH